MKKIAHDTITDDILYGSKAIAKFLGCDQQDFLLQAHQAVAFGQYRTRNHRLKEGVAPARRFANRAGGINQNLQKSGHSKLLGLVALLFPKKANPNYLYWLKAANPQTAT